LGKAETGAPILVADLGEKAMNRLGNWILAALILGRFSTGMAATTWYVNWLTGIDSNNCRSATAACRTTPSCSSRYTSA
jgi:hypothetical protein